MQLRDEQTHPLSLSLTTLSRTIANWIYHLPGTFTRKLLSVGNKESGIARKLEIILVVSRALPFSAKGLLLLSLMEGRQAKEPSRFPFDSSKE